MTSWIDLIEDPPESKHFRIKRFVKNIIEKPFQNMLTINIFLLILALIFGFLGYLPNNNQNFNLIQVLYNTLRLWIVHDSYTALTSSVQGYIFTIKKKDLISIASLLALFVSLYFILRIGTTALKNQLKLIRIKRSNSHVVICGLSDKGYQLALDFCKKGDRVIVIEHSENNKKIVDVENYGALVYIGDAKDMNILKNSRVYKAKYVICVSNDDLVNVSVALNTFELCTKYKNHFNFDEITELDNLLNLNNLTSFFTGDQKTKCIVHLKNFELEVLFQQHQIFSKPHPLFEVQLFNVYEDIARYFFFEFPPYELSNVLSPEAPPIHYLISKFNDLAEAIIIQSIKIGHYTNEKPIRVTIVDPDCELKQKQFFIRYPKERLEKLVSIEIIKKSFEDIEFQKLDPNYPINSIIISENDDITGLNTSLNLLNKLGDTQTTIFVYIKDDFGLEKFLAKNSINKLDLSRVTFFGMKEKVSTIQMIVQEKLNRLAKEIHQEYLSTQNYDTKTNISWEFLPQFLKNSNKEQADHIPVKLHLIHAKIQKMQEKSNCTFAFAENEIELLSRVEHNRWVANRILTGWKYGKEKSNKLKTHPDLKDYKLLEEHIKDLDRNTVKMIPDYLKRLNLEIVRINE